MKKDQNNPESANLRQRAEDILKTRSLKSGIPLSEAEMLRLIHELEVHQIELEMQNDELIRARLNAQIAADKYTELYDFAPAGYFTITKEGAIINLNLYASQLLGNSRSLLMNRSFASFLSASSKHEFNRFLENIFKNDAQKICEVVIEKDGNLPVYLELTGIADENGEHCFVTSVDLTEHIKTLEELAVRRAELETIYNDSPVMLCVLDEERRVLFANQAFTLFTGIPEEELKGGYAFGVFGCINASDDPSQCGFGLNCNECAFFIAIKDTLNTGVSHRNVEYNATLIFNGLVREVFLLGSTALIKVGGMKRLLLSIHDITDRKQKENEIRKIGQYYQAITENAPDGIVLLDAEGKFKYISPSALKIFGYDETEVLTTDPMKLTHPDDLSFVLPEMEKLLADPSYTPLLTYRFIDKSGTWKWVESAFRNLLGDPSVESIVINFRDITERKLTESSLHEKEELFRRVVEHIGDAVILDDTDGKVLFANDRFLTLFGFSKEDLNKITLDDYIADDWKNELHNRHDRRLQGEDVPDKFEYEGIKKDGRRLWIEVNVVPVKDQEGRIIGTQSAMRDITERKQLNDELQVALEKYKTLFYSFPLGITVTDENGGIIESNPGAEKLLGISAESQRQRKIDGVEWSIIRTDGSPMPPDEYASVRAIREKHLVENVEMGIVKPDSSITWINVTAAPLPVKGYGVVVTYGDISHQKKAEETIKINEQRYRSFIDSTSDYVFLKDEQFKHLVANKSYCKSYNMTEADILGKTDFDLMPEPFAIKCNFSDKEAISMNEVVITEEKWNDETFETVKFPVEYQKGKIGVGGYVRNISRRKKTEEQLKESIAIYKLLSENISDVVWLMDFNMKVIFISPSGFKIRGYTFEELQLLSTEKHLTPESFEIAMSVFKEKMAELNANPSYVLNLTLPLEFYCKDGLTVWMENRFKIIRDENGSPVSILGEGRDISERIRIEKELRESEEKYRDIVNWAPIGIYQSTLDGNFLFVNQQLTKILGYESVADLISKNIENDIYLIPSERQSAIARYTSLGYVFNYDIRWKKKDGTPIWISLSTHAIKDKDGITQYFEGFVFEITERKSIEEKLQESEKKFRNIFENSLVGISLTSVSGKMKINNAFSLITGYTEDDLSFLTWREITHPDDIEMDSRIVRSILSGEKRTHHWEKRYICKDGKLVWVDICTVLQTDDNGKPLYFITAIVDITEYKIAEMKIRESERRFREMLKNVELVAVSLDIHGTITFINDYCLKLTGWKAEEVIGQNWFKLFIPAESEIEKIFFASILNGQMPLYQENVIVTRDGKIRLITWNNTVLRDFNGNVMGTSSIGTDITDRKQAEEKINLQLEELQRWHEVTLGREDRNRQLKSEVNELLVRLGETLRYPSQKGKLPQDSQL